MLLQRLRERTAPLHARLEAVADLMSPTLSRARYGALLKRFYGYYQPLERLLSKWTDWSGLDLQLERRRKLPAMLTDFAALGVEAMEIDAIALCPSLPGVDSLEDALGCLYVFEGATLGGQVISRHLQARFGMDARTGSAFFGSYGPEVGPMWKRFVAALTSYPATAPQGERIIQAACRSFQSFGAWLESGETR